MRKQYLAEIAAETAYCTKDVEKKFPKQVEFCKKNTRYFSDFKEVALLNKEEKKYKENEDKKTAVINVVNMDSIECGLWLKTKKLRPLVLNMASDIHPGGGWKKGSMAQEEELFRRTTYTLSLDQPEIRKKYRLPLLAGIYSPGVIVFRGTNEEEYYLYDWDDCTPLDFIAVAALRRPELEKKGDEWRLKDKDADITESKIRMIFETAIYYGNDCLVLSALGCGSFANPPKHIAEIFKKVIKDYEKYFKNITFAILTDHNDKYGNLENFKKVFGVK
jgi:uncharacterized protein (TIGR02452 family)